MQTSIKFPIGARVKHAFAGPATVTGHPFPGETGDINLPVKFDNPIYAGSSGWFERLFDPLPPLDGEMKNGSIYCDGRWHQITPRKAVADDIYPPGYFFGRVTVRTPFQYGRNDRFWRERFESERRACLEYYEAHKEQMRKNIELRRELAAAQEEIKRRVANIDKLEGTLDGIRRIMA